MLQLTGVPSRAVQCRPWCTEHDESGLCLMASESPAYGQTTVTYTPDEGTFIWLLATREELTLDGAEALANALLVHVANVRAAERVGR